MSDFKIISVFYSVNQCIFTHTRFFSVFVSATSVSCGTVQEFFKGSDCLFETAISTVDAKHHETTINNENHSLRPNQLGSESSILSGIWPKPKLSLRTQTRNMKQSTSRIEKSTVTEEVQQWRNRVIGGRLPSFPLNFFPHARWHDSPNKLQLYTVGVAPRLHTVTLELLRSKVLRPPHDCLHTISFVDFTCC